MNFPHSKSEGEEYGHSPGNGTTEIPLSSEPLATEGEATPGPDELNPYDEREYLRAKRGETTGASMPDFEQRDPTARDDPFAFDDAGSALDDLTLPEPEPKAKPSEITFNFL